MSVPSIITLVLVGGGLIFLAVMSFSLTVDVLREFRPVHDSDTGEPSRPF